jgi:hypothetical protein
VSLLILAILGTLALLVVAGPVLEDLIDRVWPPDDARPRTPGAEDVPGRR